MARKEEIRKAASEYIVNNSIDEYIQISDCKDSFIEGAKWTDNHPKSPWISVKDDLPYKHQELITNNIYQFLTIKVLIKTKVRVHTAFMIKDIINDKWIWYGYGEDENQITH